MDFPLGPEPIVCFQCGEQCFSGGMRVWGGVPWGACLTLHLNKRHLPQAPHPLCSPLFKPRQQGVWSPGHFPAGHLQKASSVATVIALETLNRCGQTQATTWTLALFYHLFVLSCHVETWSFIAIMWETDFQPRGHLQNHRVG